MPEFTPTQPQRRPGFWPLSLFLFLFALYLFTYRGGFHSVDEVSTFAVTENLVKFGQFHTNQIAWTQWVTSQSEAQGFFGRDGNVYSKKGLAISLAQAPLYGLALLVPGLGMLQTVSLLNALLTAGTTLLIHGSLRRLDVSPSAALITALLYGLGTLAWVYARYLFSGTLAGFLLMLTTYLLLAYQAEGGRWRLGLAGLSAGLTVLARANNLLLLVIFGLYLVAALASRPDERPDPRQPATWRPLLPPLLTFIGGAALAGLLLAWYNWYRSGNPLQTGYDLSIFSPNILLGLYKLLFSPLRGLFVYSPLLLLAGPGWFLLRRRVPAAAWLVAAQVGVTLLLFSAWASGEGLSWGSRFLVPVVPLLMLAVAPLIERFPRLNLPTQTLIGLLTGLSITIQILGVSINPWVYLAQLQADFGGAFFLERTAALSDFSTTQILGQLRYWEVTHSDLAWWQPGRFDWLAFAAGLGLLLVTAWLLWRTAGNRPLPRAGPLALLLALGVTVFLLTRYYRTDPQFGGEDNSYIQALQATVAQNQNRTPVLTVAQYDYHVPMNRFKARVPLIGFAQSAEPLPATAGPLLRTPWRAGADRTWLVTVGRRPAEMDNRVEAWLAERAFPAGDTWFGEDTRLLTYGLASGGEQQTVDQILGGTIRLATVQHPATLTAGQILPLELRWEVLIEPVLDYVVFLQLIAIDGRVVAQRDAMPQGGYRPTSSWSPGQTIIDHHGLILPTDLPPGDYRLIGGLYDPGTGLRLASAAGPDFLELGIVTVRP